MRSTPSRFRAAALVVLLGALGCSSGSSGPGSPSTTGQGGGNGNAGSPAWPGGGSTATGGTSSGGAPFPNGNAGSGNPANGSCYTSACPPLDANGTYQAAATQEEASSIANAMWATLTSAPCWTLRGSSNDYQFFGNLQYRYAGTASTYSGTIGLRSVGWYELRYAALLDIDEETKLMVLVDSRTFVMTSTYEGNVVANVYDASETCS